MTKSERPKLEAQALVLKAMAHPSRLLMIQALENGPKCVCELQALVAADMSTVSKHLSVLKQAHIVKNEKKGTMIMYSLTVPCILKFLNCVDNVIRKQADDHNALK